jgi:hypothetical protein
MLGRGAWTERGAFQRNAIESLGSLLRILVGIV